MDWLINAIRNTCGLHLNSPQQQVSEERRGEADALERTRIRRAVFEPQFTGSDRSVRTEELQTRLMELVWLCHHESVGGTFYSRECFGGSR